jgi:hypothetical protein
VTLGDLSSELFSAASIFNEVSYCEQPGTEAGYRMIADLDGRLHDHGRTPVGAAAATTGSEGWTPVR